MLCIMSGILLALGIVWSAIKLDSRFRFGSWFGDISVIIAGVLLVAGLFGGFFYPVSGYESTPELVEMVPITTLGDTPGYVKVHHGVCTVYVDAKDELAENVIKEHVSQGCIGLYKSIILPEEDVTFAEIYGDDEAYYAKYVTKPKSTFFTFGFAFDKETYVVYCPKGGIVYN